MLTQLEWSCLSLKGNLKVAIKGHGAQGRIREMNLYEFSRTAREIKALREEVEPMLEEVYGSFFSSACCTTPEMLEEALMYPKQSVKLVGEEKT